MCRAVAWFLALAWLVPDVARAPDEGDIRRLPLRDWQPRSMLITQVTEVPKPAFPAIDVPNHLGGGTAIRTPERVRRYLVEMDAAGGHHRQGFGMIYGVCLPKEVLEKLYVKDAERLLVGLKPAS